MKLFINDYENGLSEKRYVFGMLPNLSFEDNSFDLVLSSHFLFLYSEQFDLNFHINSILEMCRISKEVRIFPILDLNNNQSIYLLPTMKILSKKRL